MSGLSLIIGDTIIASYGFLVLGIALVYSVGLTVQGLWKVITWRRAARGTTEDGG